MKFNEKVGGKAYSANSTFQKMIIFAWSERNVLVKLFINFYLLVSFNYTRPSNLLGIKYHKTSNVKETSGGGKSPNVRSLTPAEE